MKAFIGCVNPEPESFASSTKVDAFRKQGSRVGISCFGKANSNPAIEVGDLGRSASTDYPVRALEQGSGIKDENSNRGANVEADKLLTVDPTVHVCKTLQPFSRQSARVGQIESSL